MRLKTKDIFLILLLNLLFIFGLTLISSYFNFLGNISLIGVIPVIILLIVLFLFRFDFKELKKTSKNDFRDIIYAILLFFPVSFIGRLIAPEFDNLFAEIFNLNFFGSYMVFMGLTVLPLLKEEIIERISQLKLSKAYGSKLSVIFLSINFGLLHFLFGNLYLGLIVSISVFFSSLILTSFYERTRNFLFVFLVHVIYDFIIVLQIYLHLNNITWEWIFWGVYGVLFLIFAKKSWKQFTEGFNRFKSKIKLSIGDWIFLIIFGLLPLVINLIY